MLEKPFITAILVAEEPSLLRIPRQLQRKIKILPVDIDYPFQQQIDTAIRRRPDLLVIDHLDKVTARHAFHAASTGLRVITQMDTILYGSAIARQLIDFGITRQEFKVLRWILATQRMSVLCAHCKIAMNLSENFISNLVGRYPHLKPLIMRETISDPNLKEQNISQIKLTFYRANGCDRCHGSGYQGDLAVFDIYRNASSSINPFNQPSLISMEEYAYQLAVEGQIDPDDLLNLESNHLQRTYQMLTTSEKALRKANSELTKKLLELEASNRVLLQRTEVLMSLEDMVNAMISSSSLNELATRVCRRASELCGADRVVLYLRRFVEVDLDYAEILATRGWENLSGGQQVDPSLVFGQDRNISKVSRFMQHPPGVVSETTKGNVLSPLAISMGLRVPLVAQEQLVGVMIVQCTIKKIFTPGESALLQTFANQAALAIQRAGLVDNLRAKISQLEEAQTELTKKERIERELELARQVQQAMLPSKFPPIPGIVISGQYEPARQVGGDFYDLFQLDHDHFGIVVADVANKGMPAAMYMALARSLLLSEARRVLSPRSALYNVNRLLLELGELSGFVSILYGVFDRATKSMSYCRAGHERPILLRNGQALFLGGSGTVLGIPDEDYLNLSEEEMCLMPDDRLILFTDGLVDVENEEGFFWVQSD